MTEVSKKILAELNNRKNNMIKQLCEFCAISSGSENLAGLAIMRETLCTAFNSLADHLEVHKFSPLTTINMAGNEVTIEQGPTLFISKRPKLSRRILLCGHMDTVYNDNNFPTVRLNEKQIKGPGVADMKGGLVVILQALRVFEEYAISKNLGWDIFINADEELGSPASSELLKKIAANYQAALVFEPALTVDGRFARKRCGSGKLTIIASGRTAHVGRAFDTGRNAICHLAKAIIAIDALNKQHNGIVINIGKIAGGTALNIVPEQAVAKLDVRIAHPQDEEWLWEQLRKITLKMQHDDYALKIYGNFSRQVKDVSPATARLFTIIQKLGQELNYPISWADSGGCCDGNNLANLNVPVIDTLGVRGGNLHSSAEFIELDSLVERAALTSLLLLNLAGGGLEELKR